MKPLPETKPVPILYVSGDATGVPMRKEELEGRTGKQPDGSAKTRSAYLGCVFTQHKTDEKGHPVRDYESTTYVSNLGPLEEFGPLLRQEAIRRGLGQAQKVVFLVDGAEGLENMGHLNFKDAIQIVDFYHGADHAGDVVEALLGSKEHPEYKARRSRWVRRLLGNGVKNLIEETRQECAGKPQAQQVYEELGYFVHNIERMQYRTFRRQGLFIGSGVIEAGCKTVIGSRCKQSGMFWGKPGAENILALRCIHASRPPRSVLEGATQCSGCRQRLPQPGGVAEEFCRAPRSRRHPSTVDGLCLSQRCPSGGVPRADQCPDGCR